MVAPLGTRKTTSILVEVGHWGQQRLFQKVYLPELLAPGIRTLHLHPTLLP